MPSGSAARGRAGEFLAGCLLAWSCLGGFAAAAGQSNVTVRVMASNLTSGTNQKYEAAGLRILKGLKADIVAIQEFNYANNTAADLRAMVDSTFGTNFVYYREGNGYSIPNGIISRYPFVTNGSWVDSDPGVNDRGFAWARIDVPGTNDLYVVSVHLKANSDSAARRAAEAAELKALISTNFPTNAWIIVAGDFNLYSETETALTTLKTFLSDNPVPTDAVSGGDADTNEPRTERYDRVLPSFSLTNALTSVVLASTSFPNGLVFDSAVYTPLSDVSPVMAGDSHVSGMQHMGVVKDFRLTCWTTNAATPPFITNQPQNLTVTNGNHAVFAVGAGGDLPLSYQWRFNDADLAVATNSAYTRSNAQPAHAGSYTVVVTNAAGSVTSATAVLTVLVPPSLSTQPSNQVVNQGATAVFTVTASGTEPLGYQWRFNASALDGATSSTLWRSNAQPADRGDYSVVVSNAAGVITSSNATLNLVVPSPYLTMPAADVLLWQGLSNLTYTVQAITNVTATNWLNLGTVTSPTTDIWFTNHAGGQPQQFFRVIYP